MTTMTNRRAALGAILAAGAVASPGGALMNAMAHDREPDPIFDLIEAHREAWAKAVEADYADELATEREARHRLAEDALAKLLETPPATIAGAKAVISYLVEWDDGCLPDTSGEYLPTLLRSPLFAVAGGCA